MSTAKASRPRYQCVAPGKYRAQVTHPSKPGKRISLRASSPGEMLARLSYVDELRRDVAMGMRAPGDADRRIKALVAGRAATVADICAAWRDGLPVHTQPKADSIWKRQLAPWFADLSWWELTPERLRKWESKLLQDFAPKTVSAAFAQLSAAYTMAEHEGRLDAAPWGRWRPKRAHVQQPREAARTPEEFFALVRAAREEDARGTGVAFHDLAERLIVMTLCALRQGEASALGWDDIDTRRGEATIRHNCVDSWPSYHPTWKRPLDPPKAGKVETIALHPDALAVLERQRARLQALCLVRAANLANPHAWDVHSLRHSGATLESAAGADPRDTMRRTRHADLDQLQQYTHGARELPASRIPMLPNEEKEP